MEEGHTALAPTRGHEGPLQDRSSQVRLMLSQVAAEFEQVVQENADLRSRLSWATARQPSNCNIGVPQERNAVEASVPAVQAPAIAKLPEAGLELGRASSEPRKAPSTHSSPAPRQRLPAGAAVAPLEEGKARQISEWGDERPQDDRSDGITNKAPYISWISERATETPRAPAVSILVPSDAGQTDAMRSGKSQELANELQLWSVWREGPTLGAQSTTVSTNSGTGGAKRTMPTSTTVRGGDTMIDDKSWLQVFVSGPNSRRRLAWDCLSVLVVGFDVLTVPLVFFDGVTDHLWMRKIAFLTTIFWTVDIPFTFLSGFHNGGIVEMRPRAIACHYLKHFLCLDLFIVLVDWLLIIIQSALADIIGIVRISKTLRLSRILRLFRLLRSMKVPVIADSIGYYMQSELMQTSLHVLKSTAVIAVVNHFIACCWYAVGNIEPERSWLTELNQEGRTFPYRYTTALHWSLCQFTPASLEVVPRNTYERSFTIVVLFSALVTFSSFISSITAAMTTLRRINMERTRQRDAIRSYISDNRISFELGNRIGAFLATHNFMAKRRIHEKDIQVFKALPEPLVLQLHWEVFAPRLTPHPFFHHFLEFDEPGFAQVCHQAMGELSLVLVQEDLFSCGETATKVYFAISGVCEYHHGAAGEEISSQTLEVGENHQPLWFSEVVLWLKWQHHGRLAAVTPCEFMTLEAARFRRIVARSTIMLLICREYARAYRQRVVERTTFDFVDIWCDHDAALQLSHDCFGRVEGGHELKGPGMNPTSRKSGNKVLRVWRSWTPPHFQRGKHVRSNTR